MGNAPAQLSQLELVFEKAVSSLLALGGVTLFIMLLVGGFKYLTAGSDGKAMEGAQKTLTYAIGGLVLLAGSYMLLRIIGEFTGTEGVLTDFKISK